MFFNSIHTLALEYTLLGIVFFLLFKCFFLKRDDLSFLSRYLGTLFSALFVNLLLNYYEYIFKGRDVVIIFWLHTVYFLLLNLTACYWFVFSAMQLKSSIVENIRKRHMVLLPVILALLISLTNRWTGWFYSISDEGVYHSKGIFFLQFAFVFLYIIVLLVVSIVHMINTHSTKEPEKIVTSLIPIFAGAFFQYCFGGSWIFIGFTVCTIMMYIDICLDRQTAYEVKRAVEIINSKLENSQKEISENLKTIKNLTNKVSDAEEMQELFMQTAGALSSAIDAKDKYTQGHSQRVADYAKRIATMMGMDEEVQTKVYYAGLLHDVGKIGIKDSIIKKEGKLTKEEFDEIKTHTSMGYEILKNVTRMPYLAVGAFYHHERYDGKGYPKGLKAEEIPIIARIISVADAYDAMTSKRSYREIIPQWTVREQIVECLGTQFDPEFGRCMINMIDQDSEYTMQELLESAKNAMKKQRHYNEYGTNYSVGQQIVENTTYVKMVFKETDGDDSHVSMPSFVFYDSNDTKIPESEKRKKEMNFAEFITVRADGYVEGKEIRNLQTTRLYDNPDASDCFVRNDKGEAEILLEMVKYKDHLRVRLDSGNRRTEYIAALPDSTRYVYATVTGANCDVEILEVEKDEKAIDETEIPRIAEELNFKFGAEGDIPSIQMNGWREVHSESIKLVDKLRITMHSLSLPTSRLIWHCPFIIYYVSDNHKFWGPNYMELAMLRMDGEYWSGYNLIESHQLNKLPEFENWEEWKAKNKQGVDCELSIEMQGRTIITRTYSAGLESIDKLVVPEEFGDVYITLTGDQCAITDIRIK